MFFRAQEAWTAAGDAVKTKVKQNIAGKKNPFDSLTAAELEKVPIQCIQQAKVS